MYELRKFFCFLDSHSDSTKTLNSEVLVYKYYTIKNVNTLFEQIKIYFLRLYFKCKCVTSTRYTFFFRQDFL